MSEIPTAEEFIKANLYISKGALDEPVEAGDVIEEKGRLAEKMEEYANLKAKFHVEAALKAASENATIDFQKRTGTTGTIAKRHIVNGGDVFSIWKESILSAYPLTNIK